MIKKKSSTSASCLLNILNQASLRYWYANGLLMLRKVRTVCVTPWHTCPERCPCPQLCSLD